MNRFQLQEHPLLPLGEHPLVRLPVNETDGTPVDARWAYFAAGFLCGVFWREVLRWVF